MTNGSGSPRSGVYADYTNAQMMDIRVEEQKKAALRAILTNEARERLGRIKIARPEMAESIENQLIMLAQSGKLKNKINDEELRMLLSKVLPKKRDIKIKRR